METELKRAITNAVVRRLAGERAYVSGCDYYRLGHVESMNVEANTIRAVVRAAQNYTVALSSDDGVLDYACDCPQGAEGTFCKHCVAVAIAWLSRDAAAAKRGVRGKLKQLTLADAAKVLQSEDKDTLVRMMLEWVKDDKRLRERLLQYVARRVSPETAVAAAKRAFEQAVRVKRFIGYREAAAWAGNVDDAIGNFANLLADGHAAGVVELCESGLRELEKVYGDMDDSDGHLHSLRDRLQDLHFRACEEARPEPVRLARRLFELELNSELDIFFGAAEHYAGTLGAEGLQEYRRLAEAEWEVVPVRNTKEASQSGTHFRITSIMESLARVSGNTEELVAVMSRDLSHAYNYLRIAEVYRQAGQHDNALVWAEKGLEAFPQRTDSRLREFAAEEYHRGGRHEDAIQLMWAEFVESLYLATYQTLERHARKAETWPEWRERALSEIRRRIAAAKAESSRPGKQYYWMRRDADHSQLVEIYLYECDVDAAWSEAQAGGCSDRLWLSLADLREPDYPAEAVAIYLKHAEAAVSTTRNGRYEEAVELLVKAAVAMKRIGQSAEFVRTLEALRSQYKIKRNFIKLVEQNRQLLYLS